MPRWSKFANLLTKLLKNERNGKDKLAFSFHFRVPITSAKPELLKNESNGRGKTLFPVHDRVTVISAKPKLCAICIANGSSPTELTCNRAYIAEKHTLYNKVTKPVLSGNKPYIGKGSYFPAPQSRDMTHHAPMVQRP